jgi:hypothetical protein
MVSDFVFPTIYLASGWKRAATRRTLCHTVRQKCRRMQEFAMFGIGLAELLFVLVARVLAVSCPLGLFVALLLINRKSRKSLSCETLL